MKVELIAHTVVTGWDAMREAGWVENDYALNADELAEFAGRACYESWSRPNPKTATNQGYLAHIIEVEHESVLEHASATFYVSGVSRSLLAELTRHRHLSFSVRSQRFVDESDFNFITPPAVSVTAHRDRIPLGQLATDIAEAYKRITTTLLTAGFSRKQAHEAARCVLPQATETRFVVTGNLRAWRYVIKRRIAPEADAEIRQLADAVLHQLREIAPSTFQDM